jgi:hypothetical protein
MWEKVGLGSAFTEEALDSIEEPAKAKASPIGDVTFGRIPIGFNIKLRPLMSIIS